MIPLRLSLRNFMCYRDSTSLSFDGIHVACLCGNNGHGKSALLDAITWALWGKSRARSDDDLIHQGQKDMEVELEFAAQGGCYRVTRKHSRGSGSRYGSSLLALQTVSPEGLNDISGNTMADTDGKIAGILRLDYQTFINSAFLLQGRANEFTLKQPAKRKEVLAAILGLSLYDLFEERARSKTSEKDLEIARAKEYLSAIGAELQMKTRYESELAAQEAALETAEAELKAKQALLLGLEQRQRALETKLDKLQDLDKSIAALKVDLKTWDKKAGELQAGIKIHQEKVAREREIEQGFASFVQLETESKQLAEKAQQLVLWNARMSQLDKMIEREQNALVTEHKVLLARLQERQAIASRLPALEGEWKAARQGLQDLAKNEEALSAKRQLLQETIAVINHLRSSNTELNGHLKQLDDKLHLLASGQASCPLCGSDLGEHGLQKVRGSYESERSGRAHQCKTNVEELESRLRQSKELEEELSRAEPALRAKVASGQSRLGRLDKEIADAREAAMAQAEEQPQLQAIELRLAQRSFAIEEQQALAGLKGQAAALGYDATHHQDVMRRLSGISHMRDQWNALQDARARLPQEIAELARAVESRDDLLQRVAVEERRTLDLRAEVATLPGVAAAARGAKAEYQSMCLSERSLRDEVAASRERLRRLEQLVQEKEQKEAALRSAVEEQSVYQQLAEAFGKKGVQALLIEQAIPEIEAEADRLLKRMTDNRMSLKMETQRETKKGSVLETLDIQISDELGTRNYEMFSGGEAFRIDIALRVALSRVLTRRAGASLSTLFIDEGFGTQDNSGREKLIEVINSIQDDFEKVIVITHMEELKDQFPVRIEVSKGAQGSTLFIS